MCQVGNGMIVTVAAVCQETLAIAHNQGSPSGNFTRVDGLLGRLTQEPIIPASSTQNKDYSPWKTLGLMAQACYNSDAQNDFMELMYWINAMQFASQIE